MYSNFITPPDFTTEDKHTVVLVDATNDDIQRLALLCKHGTADFNIYLYSTDFNDPEWLDAAISRADAIIVNTFADEKSTLKDSLAQNSSVYFYGHNSTIESLQKYFIDYILNDRNSTDVTL